MSNYKEIKISSPASLEEEEKGITVEFDSDIQDVDLEDVTKEPEQIKEVVEKETPPSPPIDDDKRGDKKGSSAQRRIRELNARMKEAEARAAALEAEKEELQKKIFESNKVSKSSLKETLENKTKLLTARMKEAMESGNTEEVISLQDDLINTKMELAGVLHDLKQNESVQTKKNESPKQVVSQPPARALEWIEEHPEFKTDILFNVSAIVVNNQLISEGYNPKDDDFYTELDKRLSKRFPEIFGVEDKKDVESKKDLSIDDEKDVKNNSSVKARVQEQTVSGSSRPSSTIISSPTKKTTVVLSPADIKQAESWGLSLEQMVKRIAHLEKNKETPGGYVPIKIN